MNGISLGLGGRALKTFLRTVARLLFRVKTSGDAASFTNPRTLIVANHESFLDGLLLALFLPVEATFVVHTTVMRNPVIAWLLRYIPHLAVDSTSPLSIKLICKLVESGKPVIIFPEGPLTSRAGVAVNTTAIAFGLCFAASIAGVSALQRRASGADTALTRVA